MLTSSGISRRDVLRKAGPAAAVSTAASYSRILGANNRIQLGLIGCGGRGRYVLSTLVKTDQVEIPAVCDVLPERSAEARQKSAPNAQRLTDRRKLLHTSKFDSVLIATPDHWHGMTALDCR